MVRLGGFQKTAWFKPVLRFLIFAKPVTIAFFLKEQLSTTFGRCSGQLRLTKKDKNQENLRSRFSFSSVTHVCLLPLRCAKKQTQTQLTIPLSCEKGAANCACDALD